MIDPTIKCDECGRFIAYDDLIAGVATCVQIEPSSEFGDERTESLCRDHAHSDER